MAIRSKYHQQAHIDVFQNVLVCLVYPVPTHVTFSFKNKINQVEVEAKNKGILSLLFKFLMGIIKGK